VPYKSCFTAFQQSRKVISWFL